MRNPPDWTSLRIFLAAVDLGSITQAGERCGIATAAAAKRMQVLEADAGLVLLERGARGVKATSAGEAFARYARALLDMSARLSADMNAFAAGGLGSVRLHVTASALAGHELSALLASFGKKWPGVAIELREDSSLQILKDLTESRADIGIITSEGRLQPGLEGRVWREDQLLAVMTAGHLLAGQTSVTFDEVLDHPIIGALANMALALLLEDRAERIGRHIRYCFRVANPDAARNLVAAGHGITIMPDGMVRAYQQSLGITGVPLAERWSRRRLRIVSLAADMLPPPARLLLDHLLG